MRADTKAELQMLREVAWFFLQGRRCFFCEKDLLDGAVQETFGHRRHSPVNTRITLHHIDEDRSNNSHGNLALSHDDCHRRYHATKRAAERREIIKRVEEKQSEVSE